MMLYDALYQVCLVGAAGCCGLALGWGYFCCTLGDEHQGVPFILFGGLILYASLTAIS